MPWHPSHAPLSRGHIHTPTLTAVLLPTLALKPNSCGGVVVLYPGEQCRVGEAASRAWNTTCRKGRRLLKVAVVTNGNWKKQLGSWGGISLLEGLFLVLFRMHAWLICAGGMSPPSSTSTALCQSKQYREVSLGVVVQSIGYKIAEPLGPYLKSAANKFAV